MGQTNRKKKASKKRVLKEKQKKKETLKDQTYDEMKEELDFNKTRQTALNYLVLWKEDKSSWKFNVSTNL